MGAKAQVREIWWRVGFEVARIYAFIGMLESDSLSAIARLLRS
jgi:hypothetical protein